MRTKFLLMIGSAALLAAFAVSCSRMTAEEAKLRQEFSIPADMAVKDLGAIELRADTPKRVSLGPGRDCTITASVLTNDLLQMTLHYESNHTNALAKENFSQRSKFLLHRGMQCAPQMGKEITLVMRPVIVAQ